MAGRKIHQRQQKTFFLHRGEQMREVMRFAVSAAVGGAHQPKGRIQPVHHEADQRQLLLRSQLGANPPILRTIISAGAAEGKIGCDPDITILPRPRPELGLHHTLRQIRQREDFWWGAIVVHPCHRPGPHGVAQERIGGRLRTQPGEVIAVFNVGVAEQEIPGCSSGSSDRSSSAGPQNNWPQSRPSRNPARL